MAEARECGNTRLLHRIPQQLDDRHDEPDRIYRRETRGRKAPDLPGGRIIREQPYLPSLAG